MQLGRFVKKGAKGIMILAPIMRKNTQEDLSEEETSNVTLGFRAVYVFDQADTDGKPLAELASAEGDPSGYTERLRLHRTRRPTRILGFHLSCARPVHSRENHALAGTIRRRGIQ
jgi:hypothetical protein